MPEANSILSFLIVSVLLCLSPGPDIVYVISQSISYGSRRGIQITLGLCSGLVLHTLAVVLGLAVIIRQTSVALSIIQYLGAAYLLYLAWHLWRDTVNLVNLDSSSQLDGWLYYRRGLLMNISNPKVLIFFLAFLPQFVDPDRGAISIQLVILGLLFIMAALLVFLSVSVLAITIAQRLDASSRLSVVVNKITAVVFVILSIHLVMTDLSLVPVK